MLGLGLTTAQAQVNSLGIPPPPPRPDFAQGNPNWAYIRNADCWALRPKDTYVIPRWDGACQDQKITGPGSLTSKWNERADFSLTGTAQNGEISGPAVMVLSDGTRLEGNFAGGALNGEGKAVYANGKRYSGLFHDNHPTGQGRMEEANGAVYEAAMKDGSHLGHGTIAYDNMVLEGEFENNNLSGIVTLRQPGKAAITGPIELPRTDPASPPVWPPYPTILIRLGETFTLYISFIVEADGRLTNVHYYVPTPDHAGYKEVNDAVPATLASLHFLPGRVNGEAIRMPWSVNIAYQLRDRAAPAQ